MVLKRAAIDRIRPNPFQVRRKGDDAWSTESRKQFASEIKELGYWGGPLPARSVKDGYEIAFGHRRVEALKSAGHKTVELDVLDRSDADMQVLLAVENFQRYGLTDLQKSNCIKMLESGRHDRSQVLKLLGLTETSYNRLKSLSIKGLGKESTRALKENRLRAETVATAKRIGGPDYLEKVSKKIGTVNAINVRGVEDGLRRVKKQHDKGHVYEETLKKVKAGTIRDESAVVATASELSARRRKKKKTGKKESRIPDLIDLVRRWSVDEIPTFTGSLKDIAEEVEYIRRDKLVASRFKRSLEGLQKVLQKLIGGLS